MQAGGKYRSYFDAWVDWPSGYLSSDPKEVASWDIKRFDRRTWQERFAHLLIPTFEIASEVWGALAHGLDKLNPPYARAVSQALQRAERTGQWVGRPGIYCHKCQISVSFWLQSMESGKCFKCGVDLRGTGGKDVMRELNATELEVIDALLKAGARTKNTGLSAVAIGERTGRHPLEILDVLQCLYKIHMVVGGVNESSSSGEIECVRNAPWWLVDDSQPTSKG